MKKRILSIAATGLLVGACSNVTFTSTEHVQTCQVENFSKAELQGLKQSKFEGLNETALDNLALAMLSCVGDPDPEIRDGIVFESYSYLLRNDRISDATKSQMMGNLVGVLNGPKAENGFLKPFAALDLSELVRADRIRPYLNAEQREKLVVATIEYLNDIEDYRGFNDDEGWRHGIAHIADVVLQLVLNENVTDNQLARLSNAIITQISPKSGHAYIHGESERLARPILYMARRGTFSQDDWDTWFETLADPAPYETWNDVFKSETGLAKLHNTKAFLNAVYINASVSQNENVRMLVHSSLEVMKKLP